MSLSTSRTIFTITRLNQTVRQLLENEMGRIWLTGEISNFSQPASGHWYFTLKDEKSQVRCAMFRGNQRQAHLKPQNGQQVLARAVITLYEPRGDYQLLIESLQPAGEGLLQQQFEQLKQKLQSEGLFDAQFKQPLPSPAACVGVVTSATGAALHDILQVLKRRDPSLPVVIYPTIVQGTDAPAGIARAIELANLRQECDVLIVGRGGGSLEDLWCFNDERVARAIFASRIPIVSAVGHEVDVTIADFVADLRAPTPSAAAELISRNQLELLRRLQTQQQRLEMALDYRLVRLSQRLSQWQQKLQQQHPQSRLAQQKNHLQHLQHQLQQVWTRELKSKQRQAEMLAQRLAQSQPEQRVLRLQQKLQQQRFQLQQWMERLLTNRQRQFAISCSQLEGVSPLATLARGYSVTQDENGRTVTQIHQVKHGDKLISRVADGVIESEVIQSVPVDNPPS